jgi:hypothetical protein
MDRSVRLILVLAMLYCALPAARASAQALQGSPVPADATPVVPSPDLPHPLDVPRSLYAPESPNQPGMPPGEKPYFELDSLLDPVELPQPGWFAVAEADALHVHFKDRLFAQVPIDNATPTVHAPGAVLDWAVSPRIQIGYRLESGFGEIAVTYRGLSTSGAMVGQGTDGPAALSSRLEFNILDLDYASREFSLWPCWDMKWRFGGRAAIIYYDAQEIEPEAEAAAGSGLATERNTSFFAGGGPHVGLDLARHFEDSGLSLIFRADGATIMGQLRQGFFAESTIAGNNGQTHDTNAQDTAQVTVEAGLGWQPTHCRQAHFFLGYEYEYWWNVGRSSDTESRAEMSDQGLVLRAAINY